LELVGHQTALIGCMSKVTPLEATHVFRALARSMKPQQLLNLVHLALPQRFRRQSHVGGIRSPFCICTGAVDSDDRYRRADDDDEDEDEDQSAECGEGGLAPTPTLCLGEGTHRSSEDWLPVE